MCCRPRSLAASVSRQRRDTSGFSPAFNWFYPLYARTWCYVSCLYPAQCVGQVEWTWAPHCGLAVKSGSTPTGMPQIWRQHCIVRVIAFCCTHAVMATIMKTGHLERSRFLCAADSAPSLQACLGNVETRGVSGQPSTGSTRCMLGRGAMSPARILHNVWDKWSGHGRHTVG